VERSSALSKGGIYQDYRMTRFASGSISLARENFGLGREHTSGLEEGVHYK
jgi:hypothetical protein